MHHSDFNETLEVKSKWKLRKDVACYFEQILEAAPYKTAVVQPFISYPANHQRKANKTCWAILKKEGLISYVLQWTPTHGHTSVGHHEKTKNKKKTYIHQLCADTRCHLENLPKPTGDKDWWEASERIWAVSTWWWCAFKIWAIVWERNSGAIFRCFFFSFSI